MPSSFYNDSFGGARKKSTVKITGIWPNIEVYLDGEMMDNIVQVSLELAADLFPEVSLTIKPTEIDIDIETLKQLMLYVEGKL